MPGKRGGVGLQLRARQLRLRVVLTDGGVVEPEGGTRRLDVLPDVRRLLVRLVGLDLEPLHQARPDATEQHGRDREQGEPDTREQPGASHDVGEEQHRTDHGDEHQDVLRRQDGVIARVGHPGDEAAGLRGQVEPVQPVVDALEQQEHPDQRRELCLRRAGDTVARRLQPDAAVEVVHGRREQQRYEHGRHREVDQEVQPGQAEDVEADVLAEVGVGLAEVLTVGPQQERAPLAGRGDPGEDPEDHADADQQQPAHRRDDLAVALEVGLLGRVRPEDRAQPVGQVEVDPDHERHQATEAGEQQDAGPDQLAEDVAVTNAVEPQLVGPDACEEREGDDQHTHHDDGEQQGSGAASARGGPTGRPAAGTAGGGAARLFGEEVTHASLIVFGESPASGSRVA